MSARPRVSLIWAMAEDRIIGLRNALPWHLPADLQRFRALTTGHHIVMGRRTFESFPRPLPNRTHIIVTTNTAYRAPPGCKIVHSPAAALDAAPGDAEIFVIGGAMLYAQMLPFADRLYMTLVHGHFDGDARFPPVDWARWREVSRESHGSDARHPCPLTFVTLERSPDS